MPILIDDMKSIAGVIDIHDLHVWSIGNGICALSCHALIDDLPPSQSTSILQMLEAMLLKKYQIGHTTIQFESHYEEQYCSVSGLYCQVTTPHG